MTLLDERTREQLHNLANVVTEYTNPGAVTYEPFVPQGPGETEDVNRYRYDWRRYRLTRRQSDRACFLRRIYQWHSRTIAEALGLVDHQSIAKYKNLY